MQPELFVARFQVSSDSKEQIPDGRFGTDILYSQVQRLIKVRTTGALPGIPSRYINKIRRSLLFANNMVVSTPSDNTKCTLLG